jgi:hypothetical protein
MWSPAHARDPSRSCTAVPVPATSVGRWSPMRLQSRGRLGSNQVDIPTGSPRLHLGGCALMEKQGRGGGPAGLQHPGFACAYARAVEGMNRRGGTEHRRSLLAGLHGKVIEIGAGNGSTFGLYPAAVTHVLALEPEDYLRTLARGRAASAPVPITVSPGAAKHIAAADASVDVVVVTSLVLCSVADQAPVLAEIRRVLRPGGTLAFYEHVRSDHRLFAAPKTCSLRYGGGSREAATPTETP